MRIGLMIGPERGRYREKVARARRRRRGGRGGRLHLDLGAADPGRLRRPDRHRAHGPGDRAGSSSAPPSCRSRPATRSPWRSRRCRPRRCAKAGSRSGSGRRTTGSSRTCSACPTSEPAAPGAQLPRGAERGVRGPRPGRRRERRLPRAQPARRHRLAPTPVLLAALAPVMLRIAGEHASGTILWMADERAIGEHVVPRITKAAAEAGRPAPRIVAGRPGRAVRRRRGRRGARVGEPGARARRVLAELPAAARARRRHRRRRHARGGRRSRRRRAAAQLPRRRASPTWRSASLPLGADREARIESRRADRGVPRVALPRAVTRSDGRVAGPARRHPRARGRPHPRRTVRRDAARRPRRRRHQDRADRAATCRARSARTSSTSTTCTSRA